MTYTKRAAAFVLAFSALVSATTTTARDVLKQLFIQTGWASIETSGVTISGALHRGEVRSNIKIWAANGLERIETGTSNGVVRKIARQGEQFVIRPQRSRELLPNRNVAPFLAVPFSGLASMADNPSAITEIVGEEILRGEPAYRVRLTVSAQNSGRGLVIDAWISQRSYLLLQIEYKQPLASAPARLITVRRTFDDYRRVDSILFPFAQAEYLGDSLIWKLQVEGVKVEPLDPTVFAVEVSR